MNPVRNEWKNYYTDEFVRVDHLDVGDVFIDGNDAAVVAPLKVVTDGDSWSDSDIESYVPVLQVSQEPDTNGWVPGQRVQKAVIIPEAMYRRLLIDAGWDYDELEDDDEEDDDGEIQDETV